VADLYILRQHALGLRAIRKIAFSWADLAEKDFGMSCVYQEGRTEDILSFTAPGVRGSLLATHSHLEINVELGLLVRPFKSKVEFEILKNLDLLLQETPQKKRLTHAKR